MHRLAAFASSATRVRMQHAYREIDFDFLSAGDRLERCIRTNPIYGVFVFAPDVAADDVAGISVVLEFPCMPVIFCGQLTRELSAFVSVMPKHANPRVFIEHFEDASHVMQFISEQSPAREQLLFRAGIADLMERLPGRVRLQLETTMGQLPVESVVRVLAARLRCTERAVLDAMHAAGFANTHAVFAGQRIIDAWGFVRDPGYRYSDIARKSGYGSQAGLLYLVHSFGVRSLEELAQIPSGEIVPMVVNTVLRR